MSTEEEQTLRSKKEWSSSIAQDPEAACDGLNDAACATERALKENVPLDQLMCRILTNQAYMLNVLRWLVGREADRIRQEEEK